MNEGFHVIRAVLTSGELSDVDLQRACVFQHTDSTPKISVQSLESRLNVLRARVLADQELQNACKDHVFGLHAQFCESSSEDTSSSALPDDADANFCEYRVVCQHLRVAF